MKRSRVLVLITATTLFIAAAEVTLAPSSAAPPDNTANDPRSLDGLEAAAMVETGDVERSSEVSRSPRRRRAPPPT